MSATDPNPIYEAAMQALLEQTGASRTTLRLNVPGRNYPVIAEAVFHDVPSIRVDESIDQRNLPTIRWLTAHRDLLTASDALTCEPATSTELIEGYGLRAFMLGPLAPLPDGELIGWVSVHENRSVREWSRADEAALWGAVAAVQEEYNRREAG